MANFFQKIFGKKTEPKNLGPEIISAPGKQIVIEQSFVKSNHWGAFGGEKDPGEMGPVVIWEPDYFELAARSWAAYLESDIAQIGLKSYLRWVIGTGLKLQCEPSEEVLKSEGISMNRQKLAELAEARFGVWAMSNESHYGKNMNFFEIQKRAEHNAIIGGCVLVILRYENVVNIQLIDGFCLGSPLPFSGPNTIKDGVEWNERGQEVAYWVYVGYKYERIPAYNSAGLRIAFLKNGLRYREEDRRGLPIIAAVLQKGAQLTRYTEAAVSGAEERQKVAFFIEHNQFSTGENPMLDSLLRASDINAPTNQLPTSEEGQKLANKISASTNRQAWNMPNGSKLSSFASDMELSLRDFLTVNADFYFAALEVPPNVAMQKYDSNFSASRAALKDWEHTLGVKRNETESQFLKHVYNFWFHMEVLSGKLRAPGYLQAFEKNNIYIVESYRNCRFTGPRVPHIDHVKEVEAVRRKLGPLAEHIPLITIEKAVEELNGTDSDSMMEQFSEEIKFSEKIGIKKIEPPPTNTTANQ